jgi:hypothetical protein
MGFVCSAQTFDAVLRSQPDATDALVAACAAAFAALDTSPSDEREWFIRAELGWPIDRVSVVIEPTGRTCPVPDRRVLSTKGSGA